MIFIYTGCYKIFTYALVTGKTAIATSLFSLRRLPRLLMVWRWTDDPRVRWLGKVYAHLLY